MKKVDLTQTAKRIKMTMTKHSPEILMGFGIAGMITTTVLAVKATPKALILIEEEKYNTNKTKLKPLETVKVAWKPYIPAAITCTLSTACLISANTISVKRNTALFTAYKLCETNLAEYKDKVIETIGEKKEQTIKEKVAKEKIDKNPVTKNEVIVTSKGDTLCYDSASGRYFKSDIETIKRAVNNINRRMVYDVYISLNEFYDELDLEHTVLGDDLGWNLDGGLLEIDFSAQIADDNTPCIVLNYNISPRYGFSKLY